MILRLGTCVASLAIVGACVAAALTPHRAATPPTITRSAVVVPGLAAPTIASEVVLRAPMLVLHPLSVAYVLSEPVAVLPATRLFSTDRLRDESSTKWRSLTCDGSLPCNRNDATRFLDRRQL